MDEKAELIDEHVAERNFRRLSRRAEFWFRWAVVTGIGWPVGVALASLLTRTAGLSLTDGASLALSGFLAGLLIGAIQWQFLPAPDRGVVGWTLATVLAWLAGLLAAWFGLQLVAESLGWLVAGLAGGLAMGLVQWAALPQWRRGERDWFVIPALVWIAAMGLGRTLPLPEQAGALMASASDLAAGSLLGWTLIGLLAGLGLVLVFARPYQYSD